MKTVITKENFIAVRTRIQYMIDHYRINIEKWVVDQFNDIPANPEDGGVMALCLWMERFLTPGQQSELLEHVCQTHHVYPITLSRELMEQMDSVRRFYKLKTMEETVATLLDCFHRHP